MIELTMITRPPVGRLLGFHEEMECDEQDFSGVVGCLQLAAELREARLRKRNDGRCGLGCWS